MEAPKTQFISPQEEMSGENLFKELENELDFGDFSWAENAATEAAKKHPLQIASTATNILFKLLLVASFVLGADVTIRDLESSSYFAQLPICSYLIWWVDYENTECKSYVELKDQIAAEREQYEKDLTVPLARLVPKKLQSENILNSPEVQFIQLRTANRILLSKIMDRLNELKASSTIRKGEDIECKRVALDEKGTLSVSCDCYGFGLNSGGTESNTSRSTALAFMEKLSDKNSNFQVLEMPKILTMDKFASSDLGIKSTFSTQTTINLKLRFIVPNKS